MIFKHCFAGICVTTATLFAGCATAPTTPSPLMSYSATPLNAFVSRPPVTGTPVATAPAVNTVSLPNIAPATNTAPPATQTLPPVIRGQTTPNQLRRPNSVSAGSDDHMRLPMLPVGEPVLRGQDSPFAAQMQPGYNQSPVERLAQQPLPPNAQFPGVLPPGNADPLAGPVEPLPPTVDFDVFVEETRTGRFMFGMGVNSDLGVTGQIVIDERNFDWRRPPSSWQDFVNGTAWRGGGQGFRMEAAPGTRVQRYLITFTQPYLYLGSVATPFSLNLSGFYYDRRYFDWDEQRLGGRVALGYRLAPDLSLSGAIRAENVNIHDPRVIELVPELDRVIGDNDLYSGRTTLTYDTRDTPFAATQGHLIKLGYEQVFGSFDYPRGDIDYRQYFRVRERPDGSGRHTLAYAFQFGFSGEETPIFENYFAGGFSTMRGFDFRGASPVGAAGVTVGGRFQFLGSVEYMFPLTADDMVKGVVFCDYGTVERDIEINADNYRVSPGFGLRIAIPAMGPAPLALDLAFPVEHAPTDDVQNFSFFFGFGR